MRPQMSSDSYRQPFSDTDSSEDEYGGSQEDKAFLNMIGSMTQEQFEQMSTPQKDIILRQGTQSRRGGSPTPTRPPTNAAREYTQTATCRQAAQTTLPRPIRPTCSISLKAQNTVRNAIERRSPTKPAPRVYEIPDSESEAEGDTDLDIASSSRASQGTLFSERSYLVSSQSSISSSQSSISASRSSHSTVRFPPASRLPTAHSGRPWSSTAPAPSAPARSSRSLSAVESTREHPSPARTRGKPMIAGDIHQTISALSGLNLGNHGGATVAEVTAPPSAIQRFLSLPLGKALDVYVIAHDPEAQNVLDDAHVEWGAQWEIARGVQKGHWTWNDVVALRAQGRIRELSGTNADKAPRVPGILVPKREDLKGTTAMAVWTELDREEKARREDPDRRFGLRGAWEGESTKQWYGGKIQQIARLVEPAKREPGSHRYKIVLEPMETKRSHRFARYVGSRSILQLRIADSLVQDNRAGVIAFLARKFVLMGRIFVPFHSKDGSVYMVETNEDYQRSPQRWCGDHLRISFVDFMEWHNPLACNSRQAISKFVTRYAIGLSNSTPSVEFESENIAFIDDIYASDYPDGKGAPAEKIMTDGCGLMNLAALKLIAKNMPYDLVPTAVQGRIAGSKGLWVRHPTDLDPLAPPRIWIRKSQNKITIPILSRAHRIFELLGPSRASLGAALSQQTILNFYHNGVPGDVLVKLFEEGLKNEVAPLLNWDDMRLLYGAVIRGGVMGAKLSRLTDNARALGFQGAQWRHDDVDSTENLNEPEESGPATYTGRNPHSGIPYQLNEKVATRLAAGFRVNEYVPLREDIKTLVKTTINTSVNKYRCALDQSISAFIVPDPFAVAPMDHPPGSAVRNPFGLLKEGEIYFRSSQPMKNPVTGLAYHVVVGEVVVGRYPMRLPSDLQQVTAVNIPELEDWTDVIIASVRGERSLASLLSGGDMDGDLVYIFREPELVDNFETSDFNAPPPDLMEYFESQVESVAAFCERVVSLNDQQAAVEYQNTLLGNIESPIKGLYSSMHDKAVADYGYASDDAILLAYIFNTLLDASKSGLRLKEGIFDQHKEAYGFKPDPYGILAELRAAGERISRELLQPFEPQAGMSDEEKKRVKKLLDPDLVKPYDDLVDLIIRLTTMKSPLKDAIATEMSLMRKQVQNALTTFKNAVVEKMQQDDSSQRSQSSQSQPSQLSPRNAGRAKAPKSDQEDLTFKASQEYRAANDALVFIQNLDEVKASYAYKLCCEWDNNKRFAEAVAFQELCLIKARAHPTGFVSVIHEIEECKTASSSAMRLLKGPESEEF